MSDAFGLLILVVMAVVLYRTRKRLSQLEEQARESELRIRELLGRVYGLEIAQAPRPVVVAPPPAARPPEPAPEPEPLPEPVVVVVEPEPEPVFLEPAPTWGERVREKARESEWEAVIGGNWLNKAGVLLLVIGIALFIAFSLTHMGPGGRVAVGVTGGLLMLAAGVVIERKPDFRAYARGLIGGGWAALYFSVYAAHEIAVAKVIDDDLTAMALLFATSLGMIVHSLRYRSQTVTGMAYFVSFVTLAIAPLTPFSVAASIPLAASLLWLARRFEWTGMALAGLVTTYVVYLANAARSHSGNLAAGEAVLFVYWVLFESFDLLSLRRPGDRSLEGRLIFPLNAVGLVLISLLQYSKAAPDRIYLPLGLAAIAYAASMAVRLWMVPPARFTQEEDTLDRVQAGSYEGALTLAAVLAGVWIPMRLHGFQINFAYLAEAELIFLAGWWFGQRYPRQLGSALFLAPLFKLAVLDFGPAFNSASWAGHRWNQWSGLAAPNAALFYLNRILSGEASRYGYPAAALVAIVLLLELPAQYLGFGWLVFAAVLFEIGLRPRLADFRQQCYGIGMLSLAALALINVLAVDGRPEWIPQALSTALLLGAAVRLYHLRERTELFNVVTAAASVLAATLTWNVLPAPVVALAWAGLALLLAELGCWLQLPFLRTEAYLMNGAACGRLFLANFTGTGTTGFVSHRLLTVGPVIGLQYYLRDRIRHFSTVDAGMGRVLLYSGAVLTAVLLRFELGHVLAVDGWAVMGLVLVWLGVKHGNRDLRLQSYALALGTFWRAWTTNFYAPEMYVGGYRRGW